MYPPDTVVSGLIIVQGLRAFVNPGGVVLDLIAK